MKYIFREAVKIIEFLVLSEFGSLLSLSNWVTSSVQVNGACCPFIYSSLSCQFSGSVVSS